MPLCACQCSRLSHQQQQHPIFQLDYLTHFFRTCAFRAFEQRPRTGIVYNANNVPAASNLPGIKITAVRLRSGSLKRRGIYIYKEFDRPIGVVEQPFVERLVLVYQNLGNCSSLYYPLPGYTYLSPVVGVLAYEASNLSAKSLSELDIRASKKPIFPNVRWAPQNGVSPMCVHFDLYGSVEFDNVLNGNVCSTTKQSHFSIVVEFTAPAPPPPPAAAAAKTPPPPRGGVKVTYKEFIVVGSAVGGVVLVTLLAIIVIWVRNCRLR